MRLLTPAIKYWVCKSAPGFLYEAMECLGGNGYVEEGILARHYRESPVNAIWEGSGNVMCLDVLRALSREAEAAPAVLQDLTEETRGLPGAAEAAAFIAKAFRRPDCERVARLAVERLALLAATAALNAVSPRHARIVRRDAPCRESRQHVRRSRSRQRRHPRGCSSVRCREHGRSSTTTRKPSDGFPYTLQRPASPVDVPPAIPDHATAAADLEILGHRRCGACSSLPRCSSGRSRSSPISCCGRAVRSISPRRSASSAAG